MREFTVVVERGQDGWLLSTVPELDGCHTQAMSLDELMARTREAIELVLDATDSTEDAERNFIGVHRIAV